MIGGKAYVISFGPLSSKTLMKLEILLAQKFCRDWVISMGFTVVYMEEMLTFINKQIEVTNPDMSISSQFLSTPKFSFRNFRLPRASALLSGRCPQIKS